MFTLLLQLPAAQCSATVQLLASSQLVPSAKVWSRHCPVLGSHKPARHAPSPALQSSVAPPHAPALQWSSWVQALWSSQVVLLFLILQPSGSSQESSVHGFSSSQRCALPLLHTPCSHTLSIVQA
jgi:hypothetical protein